MNNYENPLVRMTINGDCPFVNPNITWDIIDSGSHVDNSLAIVKYEPKPKPTFDLPIKSYRDSFGSVTLCDNSICQLCGCTLCNLVIHIDSNNKTNSYWTTVTMDDYIRHKFCKYFECIQDTITDLDSKIASVTRKLEMLDLQ